MYTRVPAVKVRPERLPEAVRLYEVSAVPALGRQRGFEGALLLTQPESGQGISITATPDDQVASETSGVYREQRAEFAGLFVVAPIREVYELNARA